MISSPTKLDRLLMNGLMRTKLETFPLQTRNSFTLSIPVSYARMHKNEDLRTRCATPDARPAAYCKLADGCAAIHSRATREPLKMMTTNIWYATSFLRGQPSSESNILCGSRNIYTTRNFPEHHCRHRYHRNHLLVIRNVMYMNTS